MRSNVIEFLGQKYLVNDSEIKEISFEDTGEFTLVHVTYRNNLYKEKAFKIPNEDNNLDITVLSYLYIQIMTTNHQVRASK